MARPALHTSHPGLQESCQTCALVSFISRPQSWRLEIRLI